jgi:hypothetical protein
LGQTPLSHASGDGPALLLVIRTSSEIAVAQR